MGVAIGAVCFLSGVLVGRFWGKAPRPPFAYEVRCDGQEVRIESPTEDGLGRLVRDAERA